jgi:hypothetical protein
MPKVEIDRRSVVERLRAEGWIGEGGAKHEKFAHPDRPGIKIMVPRHRMLSPGVARNIAGAAGWI